VVPAPFDAVSGVLSLPLVFKPSVLICESGPVRDKQETEMNINFRDCLMIAGAMLLLATAIWANVDQTSASPMRGAWVSQAMQ
jgi:hypothetical protein